jgi:pyrrolysine biosynthesis protein PylD
MTEIALQLVNHIGHSYVLKRRFLKPDTRNLKPDAMTRLTTNDIATITEELQAYDSELRSKTGCTLYGIACKAAGIHEPQLKNSSADLLVGVVPITFGNGIISGFCEAVAGIVSHAGCRAFVAQTADVAGISEAVNKQADILMFADDDRFVALNMSSRVVVDNAEATAGGYVAGLDLMAGGLKDKDVLVIGCGPVGSYATEVLAKLESRVSVYDVDTYRSMGLADRLSQLLNAGIEIVKDIESALINHQLIVDATPAADIIKAHCVTSETYISAPGVPLGLDGDAQAKVNNRLLHDPLQIGVATMVACALKAHIKGSN